MIADGPANVGPVQVQHLLGHGCEASNAQIASQHHDRQGGAGEQVRQIVTELPELDVAMLQLVVQRVQFFIARLKFLLRRLELLVRAL